MITAAMVSDAYYHALCITESPFYLSNVLFRHLSDEPPLLHRDYLTRVQINWLRQPIPRLAVVRRNLTQLGSVRLNPGRLR